MRERIHRQHAARAALEWFDRGARVAILTRHKGRTVVRDLVEVEFPAAPEGQTLVPSVKGAAIRDALRSRGWRLRQIALVLPKNLVTMRLVTLPSTNDAELVEMARFEAQKHIPFNVERHIVAHSVIRKEGVEGSRTLVVAVDRAALEEPIALCREARLDITAICVSSLALVEALLLDPPAGYSEQTFALVNLGWSTVDITIVSGGIVRFTRSGTMGVERITPLLRQALGTGRTVTRETIENLDALAPEEFFQPTGRRRVHREPMYTFDDFGVEESETSGQRVGVQPRQPSVATSGESPDSTLTGPAGEIAKWLGRLVQEIQRTCTFAARDFECPQLQTVYLAGVGSHIANVAGYLKASLNCPVTLIEPPASIEFTSSKGRDLRAAWREFAITIGAVAGSALPPVNLLPSEYTEALAKRRRMRSLTISGVLACLMIIASAAFGVRWFGDQRHQLDFYRAHNGTLAPRAKDLRDRERRYKVVREIVEDSRSAGAILELLSRLPLVEQRKVALLEFRYIKGEKVQLLGHARGYPELDRFVAELEKLGSQPDKATTGTIRGRVFEAIQQQKSQPLEALPYGRGTVVRFGLECFFPKGEAR